MSAAAHTVEGRRQDCCGAFTRGCLVLGISLAILAIGLLAAILLAADGEIYDSVRIAVLRYQLRNRTFRIGCVRRQTPRSRFDFMFHADPAPAPLPRRSPTPVSFVTLTCSWITRAWKATTGALKRAFTSSIQTQSIRQIAEILTDSSKSFITFRTPEGARIEELAELIDRNGLFGFLGADFLPLVDEGAPLPARSSPSWADIPARRVAGRLHVPRYLSTAAGHFGSGLARYAAARVSRSRRR